MRFQYLLRIREIANRSFGNVARFIYTSEQG